MHNSNRNISHQDACKELHGEEAQIDRPDEIFILLRYMMDKYRKKGMQARLNETILSEYNLNQNTEIYVNEPICQRDKRKWYAGQIVLPPSSPGSPGVWENICVIKEGTGKKSDSSVYIGWGKGKIDW